ncbi:MAG: HEPN domain-containing protein [Deltaproteobacteria bacterium]|nr:HEPN domain-containing protein [Deltaproteobacteria bacterium]
MHIDEKIKRRLDELIATGEQVLATKRSPGTNVIGDFRVDTQMAYQWATSVQNLLVRVFGQEGEHYKNFSAQVTNHLTFSPTYRAQGILKAAKDDYENEQLFEVRSLIEAELFDDFLEQSEHLLNSGYYQPAAVIAGCVLEDGLWKLCEKEGIALPSKPKLDTMNSALAKVGVFSKLVQKRITALADLRNKAAHGQWDQFTKEDVIEMIQAVRRIMEEHFA